MTRPRPAWHGIVTVAVFVMTLLAVTAPLAAASQPSAISIGAPATAQLGQHVTLQARLINSAGAPIAKARIVFVSPATFLGTSGDVVVASATTDKTGLATADWQVRRTGTLSIRAEFHGDDQYAPSKVAAPIVVSGSQQLYVQHAGVRIPGLNDAPVSGLSGLWPRLSGWPIAAALLIVWSLYGVTVFLIFRIVLASRTPSSGGLTTPQKKVQ